MVELVEILRDNIFIALGVLTVALLAVLILVSLVTRDLILETCIRPEDYKQRSTNGGLNISLNISSLPNTTQGSPILSQSETSN